MISQKNDAVKQDQPKDKITITDKDANTWANGIKIFSWLWDLIMGKLKKKD